MTRTLFACLLAGTMITGPALAQSGSQTAPKGTQAQNAQAGQSQSNLRALAAPQQGQMFGSDLSGTTVYGANNEEIGDISDLLIDRDGKVVAAIVGVGGFLGVGEKDVAVPFQALEIVDEKNSDRTAMYTGGRVAPGAPMPGTTATDRSATGSTATGSTATTGSGSNAAGTNAGNRADAGRTGASGTAGARADADDSKMVDPVRVVLRGMTKADLQNAPSFKADQ